MYKSLIVTLMLGTAMPCMAKRDNTSGTNLSETFSNSLVLSLNAGAFSGIGSELKVSVSPRLNARLGFSTISTSYNKNNYQVDEEVQAAIDAKLRFSRIHLLAEYRPFAKSSFRLVAGPCYFVSSKVLIHIVPLNSYTYRRLEISQEELGEVNATIDWSGMASYFGIGIGNSVPQKKCNITLDAGTYFIHRPRVTIDATKLLEPNKANEQQLSENLKNYRWIPQLQLNFNIKLFSRKAV